MRSSDLADGTISVTSMGEPGVDSVFGVIYPPQVAIIDLGRIAQKPTTRNFEHWIRWSDIWQRSAESASLS